MCPPGPVASGGAAAAVAAAAGAGARWRPSVPPPAPRLAALGLGLGRLRALEQVGGDLATRPRAAASPRAAAPRLGAASSAGARSAAGRLGLLRGLLGSLAEVFGDLGHGSLHLTYSGPEMPPSLRTRQKWIAMKMTMTNGSISTCSTYQRSSVSVPISAPPSSTKRTWFPNTGV